MAGIGRIDFVVLNFDMELGAMYVCKIYIYGLKTHLYLHTYMIYIQYM